MNNKLKTLIQSTVAFSLLASASSAFASPDKALAEAIANPERTEKYAARDSSRHPMETLSFFGIKNNMTVVEISPGGGWYAEILAPYLKDNGLYIAAGYDPESKSDYFRKNAKKFADKLKANPKMYANAKLGIMQPPEKYEFADDNSADMVLSFRNTHNWHRKGNSKGVYAAAFKALKPGGVFGLVQHRAGDKHPEDTSGGKGYLKQADVVKLAESVGFILVEQSEVNANPKDTKDHEKGVWTLPPVFAMGDVDKAKYQAMGESDRMTLKFMKPALK